MNSYIESFLIKAKNYLENLKVLKLRSSMILILCAYAFIFAASLSYYGYYNLIKFNNYINNREIEIISRDLKMEVQALDSTIEVLNQQEGKNIIVTLLTKDSSFIKKWFYEYEARNKKAAIAFNYRGIPVFIKGNESLDEKSVLDSLLLDKVTGTSGRYKTSINKEKVDVFYEKSIKYDYLLLTILNKENFGQATFLTANFIFYSSIMIIIFIGITYFLFKRSVYDPVKKIEKAINGIIKGDMEFEIEVDKSNELYTLAGSLNILIKRLKDLINREYNAKILKKQAELNALQSQINPHFLYNTLDSIRGLALSEGVERIAYMTKALSSLFRYSISQKGNLVSFREELKNVDNYIIIQQYRFNNKFKFIKKITDTGNDIYECKIPKLSIQPIIENAIYHGLETKVGEGTIVISAYSTEKRLVINIKDDGVGMDQDKLVALNESLIIGTEEIMPNKGERKSSIALINVNERIHLFFGEQFGIRVYSTLGQGTNIEIVLPKIINE